MAHSKVTDVKSRRTTEFVVSVDTDMIDGVINGMVDRGIPHMEFMEGLLIVVSRLVPDGA